VWFCEGRVYCFLISFSNSVPLHSVVHGCIQVLHISKYDLKLSQSALVGKLTFGVAKGVMLHYQASKREVWGLGI
jgi:translation initiation factor 6 (eIF-6)